MQRSVPQGIIIACDFCATDWDQVKPMIEGHRGSVICWECLKLARDRLTGSTDRFTCVLCLRELPGATPCYRPPSPAEQGNPLAVICSSCVQQAVEVMERQNLS